MGVILNKIDGKTVCGKVVTSFGRFLGADEYIVVNDTIMNDEAQMGLMHMSITGGADFDVVKCSTYAKFSLIKITMEQKQSLFSVMLKMLSLVWI